MTPDPDAYPWLPWNVPGDREYVTATAGECLHYAYAATGEVDDWGHPFQWRGTRGALARDLRRDQAERGYVVLRV